MDIGNIYAWNNEIQELKYVVHARIQVWYGVILYVCMESLYYNIVI